MQIQVTASDANNIICQVTPTPTQTVTIDRGVAGNGIVSIVPVTIGTLEYLRITYTNGTISDVGPITSTAYTATSPINIVGNTISLLTVPISLGGTGQTTANAGLNALLPAQTGNASKYLQTDGTNASWDAISLSTADITGVLPTANGGTGLSAFTANGVFYASSTSVVTTGAALTFDGSVFNATASVIGRIQASNSTDTTEIYTAPGFGFVGTSTGIPLLFGASGFEFMRLTLDGKLGVGTGTPLDRLHINTDGLGAAYLRMSNAYGSGYIGASAGGNQLDIAKDTSGPIRFLTGGSERVRVDTSGNVGIGTSSPESGFKLHVVGNAFFQPASGTVGKVVVDNVDQRLVLGAYFESGVGQYSFISSTNNAETGDIALRFRTGTTDRMTITNAGDVGIGTSSPATRLHVQTSASQAETRVQSTSTTNGHNALLRLFTPSQTFGGGLFATNAASTEYPASALALYNFDNQPIVFGTNNIERMRIDSSGKVGIGTSSPGARLAVVGASGDGTPLGISHPGNTSFGTAIQVRTYAGTDDPVISLENYNGGSPVRYGISCTDNGSLAFLSGAYDASFGTERARIDSSGNLLVGTTSANIGGSNRKFAVKCNADGNAIESTAASGGYFYFYNTNGFTGGITHSGTSTTYATSSDYRLKNITGPITTSGAYIDSLNPVEGTWKADGSTFVGLIAHEVQEASRTTVATGTKDGEQMQGMDYSSAEIIANLIAEVKSLRQRLAAAGI